MPQFKTSFREYLRENYGDRFEATDVIPRYVTEQKDGIVLIERKFEPLGLALVGGILENHLTRRENAIKETREETGLDAVITNPENTSFAEFSVPRQDHRADITTTVFTAYGSGVLCPHPDEDAKCAHHVDYNELKSLLEKPEIWAFEHHQKSLQMYLERWGDFHDK